MFSYEKEMVEPALAWFESKGLQAKREFVTPWGVCDLVGASFRRRNALARLKLGQKRPITSQSRASVLLQIPDADTGNSVTKSQLLRQLSRTIPLDIAERDIEHLIGHRFIIQSGRSRLQKLNGWMPLHKDLVALELKLHRIEEAMAQAAENLGFADESYVGLPEPLARRVWRSKSRWAHYFEMGVGLLAVGPSKCRTIRRSKRDSTVEPDPALQIYCVDKFWRSHIRGS